MGANPARPTPMLNALALSFTQLADRAILAVLAKTLALTLLILLALGALIVAIAGWIGDGWFQGSGTLAAIAAAAGAIVGAVLLFRAVAVAVVGLFGDEIVRAVERRHYPTEASIARDVPLGRSLMMGLGSATRAILANVAAFPLYLILLATGVGAPLLFVAVNALLLGRDLGEMVAARHMPPAALKDWLAASRGRRAATGLVVAALFVIPGVNLVAPVVGAALATHRFHRSHPR